jgi:hypothetical protein
MQRIATHRRSIRRPQKSMRTPLIACTRAVRTLAPSRNGRWRGERETAGIAAEQAQLSRERERSRSGERADELGEDREVGVEPDAIRAPDAER